MLRRFAGYSAFLLEKAKRSMSPLAKVLLVDFQEFAPTGYCCSFAGSSEMLLEVMKERPNGSRSDSENDLLMKKQRGYRGLGFGMVLGGLISLDIRTFRVH